MTKRLQVGIIMDGNRRWAKERNQSSVFGHRKGAEKLFEVLEWCKEHNIYYLSAYTFSCENFKRDDAEKEALFGLCEEFFIKASKDERLISSGVQVRFAGNLSQFPQNIQDICAKLIEKTKHNSTYVLEFCFGYGGRQEIVSCIKEIAQENIPAESITEELIEKKLSSKINPDIIIRTGKEKRLSNFLLFQSSYSELFFSDSLWPDFSKEEFEQILQDFSTRKRRKGQ